MGLGDPAVGGDGVGVVLQGLGPLVHEVLVDGVVVDERAGLLVVVQQVFGQGVDEVAGDEADAEGAELGGGGLAPGFEVVVEVLQVRGELGVVVDGGAQAVGGHFEIDVAGAVGGEEGFAEGGADGPVFS